MLAGKYTPKPLILRANVGDWLEVTLHNLWDPDRPVPYFNYPTVPLELKHKPSAREIICTVPEALHGTLNRECGESSA